jgi:hypothetical protein
MGMSDLQLMLLRIDDAALLPNLAEHFTRAGFVVRRARGDAIEVTRPDAPSSDQAHREIELHLRAWRALYPSRQIDLLEHAA